MRAVSFCIVVGTPVVPSTRRQFSHCRRHTRRGRVHAISFCIVLGMAFVAECAPSVFTLSQAHPSWPSARRQFFYSRRHARRGRVRTVNFCIVVGTSVVAEYVPSVFAFPLVFFFISSFDFFVYFSSCSSTHLHHGFILPLILLPLVLLLLPSFDFLF